MGLRAVGPDEKAESSPPTTLVEATERTRREFLVMARLKIATTIDAGVPSHALGRLIADMERLDTEIRRIDVMDAQEAGKNAEATDAVFDAEAI